MGIESVHKGAARSRFMFAYVSCRTVSCYERGVGWGGDWGLGQGGGQSQQVLRHMCEIVSLWALAVAYLLGLLAMIKCSICSYQCDN